MFLLLVIAVSGAWCAHQHWLRLDKEESVWRRSFWSWALRGCAFPALVWTVTNFGFGDRFPPLVPSLAEAQAANQPWVGRWVGVAFAGGIIILSYWAGVSYLWILSVMYGQAKNKAEFAFNIAVFGLFSGACGLAVLYAWGVPYGGAALVVALLPIVYFTLDLAEQPEPRPVYDRAQGQIKFGKYEAAEWELIAQLEKREDDFEGWMMLAELYARQHRDIEGAARVVLDVCQHPKTQSAEISLACHKLADWQMEIAENPDGARAALQLLCRKLPGTHFATMAGQRMNQLPRNAAELEERKQPKRIRLPALAEEDNPQTRRNRDVAQKDASDLVARLNDDPDDMGAREKLAGVLAVDLGKAEAGIEQLRLLMGMPDAVDQQKARWLAQIAAWEMTLRRDEGSHARVLQEIIQRFPQSAEAFAAQRRLFLLGQDRAQVNAL
jgi:hypothetical protein